MDRVVVAIDGLIENGDITEPVIVQAASFNVRPRHARPVGIVPYEELAAWAKEATVVVTHGGPGSIMLALAEGREPVVIPRMARYHEHVDDHQVQFVHWLHDRRGIRFVADLELLGQAIDDARRAQPQVHIGPSPAVISRLRTIIEADR
jgi:UDP-N-acetylglucosamine transferase subunit ALG13